MLFLVPLAITAGEAILYSAAGAFAGYVAKEAYDSATGRDASSEKRGEVRAKAEYDIQRNRFEQEMQEKLAHDKHYFNVVLAVATVGYSYAAAHDGAVSEEMRDYINDFVAGQSANHLPPRLKMKLNGLFKNTPDVDTAHEIAMKLAPNAMELCDMVIYLLAENWEQSNSSAARKFVQYWNQLRAAA